MICKNCVYYKSKCPTPSLSITMGSEEWNCAFFVRKSRAALMFLLLFLSINVYAIDSKTFQEVMNIADSNGVPRSVAKALMMEESEGNAKARSWITKEGYRSEGLFQLYTRPDNIAYLLINHHQGDVRSFDIMDPIDNANVALCYLAALHRRFGNWFQALLFYNCGRVHNAPESTRAYARRIINAR